MNSWYQEAPTGITWYHYENTLLTCKNYNYLGLWTQAIWRYFLTAYYKRHSAFSHVADLPDADNSNNENGNTFFLLIFFFFFGGRGRGCEEKVQIPEKLTKPSTQLELIFSFKLFLRIWLKSTWKTQNDLLFHFCLLLL